MTNAAQVDGAMGVYVEHLHSLIVDECVPLFRDEHYAQAIGECSKAVFHHLREKTGIDKDGVALAQEVFSEKNPVLAVSDLKTETSNNEQVGFMHLLTGFARAVRNPLAHSVGLSYDRERAFEYLVLASLLCRRIDEARNLELDRTPHPPLQTKFRGERKPCTFEINAHFTETPGGQWDNNADVAVRILSPDVANRRGFLIPSEAAPAEYSDPKWWRENKALLTEKQTIVEHFASANLKSTLRGVWFELTLPSGSKRPAIYSSSFDKFLNDARKDKVKAK
jgi:uncharacterized protein (TIGR02391 family)